MRAARSGAEYTVRTMLAVIILSLLLLYLPARLSRGFPAFYRLGIIAIVVVKSVTMTIGHFLLVSETGHQVIRDESVDAQMYFEGGEELAKKSLWEIGPAALAEVSDAPAHLGYYYLNMLAFKAWPEHPMLVLRLAKLLLFHVGLGMLATTWRLTTNVNRAFFGYVVLGLLFYQFFYYIFHNLKDDVLLSLFMIIMAVADRRLGPEARALPGRTPRRTMAGWVVIGVLIWLTSTVRFYTGLALASSFALHVITGSAMRIVYRAALAVLVVGGLAAFTMSPGYGLVEKAGGVGSAFDAIAQGHDVFKVFVSPLPWQHTKRFLAPAHTLYLILLAAAAVAFFLRFRRNLDWKLYLVLNLAIVVGGILHDFSPRKRYMMYPVFMSWVLTAGKRRNGGAFVTPASEEYGAPLPAHGRFRAAARSARTHGPSR